jgi:N-acetylglucosaminyl-diphospho-decaprenol L-rhamnosyltransferase
VAEASRAAGAGRPEALVDVVVVSYNSRDHLRRCLAPLAGHPAVRVTVVDNASPDRSLEAVADLPVTTLQLADNGGFGVGCNHGWRAGNAPFVLFLNPDARIDADSVLALASAVAADASVGAAGPRIEHEDGSLALSQRRFPRLASTYARALFLNRLFPRAPWASELVRDEGTYAVPGRPEWISGACMLVRRSLLDELGGFDEGFFLYCEDKDLCRRIRARGFDVFFEPAAVAVHAEGGSAPRPGLLPVLAASRVRYARKHAGPVPAALERLGVALLSLTRMVISHGGLANRSGHAASLRAAVSGETKRR